MVVLDEAQALKNAETKRAQAASGSMRRSGSRCPARRSRTTWASCGACSSIVFPGLLGSWDQFRQRFATPIERGRDPARARGAVAR